MSEGQPSLSRRTIAEIAIDRELCIDTAPCVAIISSHRSNYPLYYTL